MKTRLAVAASLVLLAAGAEAAVDVQVSPDAKAQAYRKVMIEPVRVELDRASTSPHSTIHGHLPRVTRQDEQNAAREMGESFEAALADAFRARGYEIARAPGADVLALSPTLKDLRVNAPDGSGSSGNAKVYVREAGQATMEVEARDTKGNRLVFASEQRTTGRVNDMSRASDVSNRFWFEAMFRRWADEFAAGLMQAR